MPYIFLLYLPLEWKYPNECSCGNRAVNLTSLLNRSVNTDLIVAGNNRLHSFLAKQSSYNLRKKMLVSLGRGFHTWL